MFISSSKLEKIRSNLIFLYHLLYKNSVKTIWSKGGTETRALCILTQGLTTGIETDSPIHGEELNIFNSF